MSSAKWRTFVCVCVCVCVCVWGGGGGGGGGGDELRQGIWNHEIRHGLSSEYITHIAVEESFAFCSKSMGFYDDALLIF